MMDTKDKPMDPEEYNQFCINSMDVMIKLNAIVSRMRNSGKSFLQNNSEAEAQKNPKAVSFVQNVDFPESGGVLTYTSKALYPFRGFPVSETVAKLYSFKKMFGAMYESFRKPKSKIKLGFFFFFLRKEFETMALGFANGFAKAAQDDLLSSDMYCQPVREIRRVFEKLGISDDIKNTLSLILEFDDSYRFRMQWAFEKADPYMLRDRKTLVKEIKRVLQLLADNEKFAGKTLNEEKRDRLKSRWVLFKKLSKLIYFHKEFRDILLNIFQEIDFSEIIMSIEDRYHATIKETFNWGLPTREEYEKQFKEQNGQK